MPVTAPGPASTAGRFAWPPTPAASTCPPPGMPGSPPAPPLGCWRRWEPGPCIHTPWAWPTGSGPGPASNQGTPRSCPWPPTTAQPPPWPPRASPDQPALAASACPSTSPPARQTSTTPSTPCARTSFLVTGRLGGAEAGVDSGQRDDRADGDDDGAGQQASGIAVGQRRDHGGVPGQLVAGHGRGDGGQRGQAERVAGLQAGVEQAGGDAAVARCDTAHSGRGAADEGQPGADAAGQHGRDHDREIVR